MTPTLRVGLTGGIGSGKTTVCSFFAQLGAPVIDADIISHELIKPGEEGLQLIINEFGHGVLNNTGTLDRDSMRGIIFNDSEQRNKLESILHPLIYKEIIRRSESCEYPYCVLSIPLLLETKGQSTVDRILVIDTDLEKQLGRASKRDKTDRDNIQKIVNSQISREQRLSAADDIITNNSDLDSLKTQVVSLHETYLQIVHDNDNLE